MLISYSGKASFLVEFKSLYCKTKGTIFYLVNNLTVNDKITLESLSLQILIQLIDAKYLFRTRGRLVVFSNHDYTIMRPGL